jgi:hypothetical protein
VDHLAPQPGAADQSRLADQMTDAGLSARVGGVIWATVMAGWGWLRRDRATVVTVAPTLPQRFVRTKRHSARLTGHGSRARVVLRYARRDETRSRSGRDAACRGAGQLEL